ncbi:hypothetical protein [Methylobacterium aerolatum]|uniref:Bacteriophage tail tape measure C-terminal domain-containing protein n=1 Tax=Methylobacterium aerolatum TaxID=418708 RepID=A0ABU0I494_9HYPH|nr:hypothetical protein [Methylobacterium aerolatum]MDQ0448843.1 hypothetical protein [Methylobacterium aerolatum]GJD34207.1 hypothetical protein FMGBMHLM_1103 [Methylobacterium aerolatum]
MAEPLVIQFVADTSRAQAAMSNLAAQIVGNMTQIGVAMSGGAANTNGFGAALEGMKASAVRAAAAVGSDVANVITATANAAAAEKASLEGVARAFSGAAATSNTAAAATSAGLSTAKGAVSGIVAQIPSLKLLLGAFIAFEAVKLVFESVAASIDEAREHVEAFVRIGREADRLGVGTTFFQRATLDAKALGLETRQVVAALERAREAAAARLGEGEHGVSGSEIDRRLTQNVRAGNLTAGDKAAYDAATTQEARIRAILDLIDKLRDEGRDLAAFDLAGKVFGPDFEAKLREGVDLTRRLRENLNGTAATAGGQRIVDPEEIERARQLDAKLTDIHTTFATALIPIQKDASNAAIDLYSHFLDVEAALARVALVASHLYTELSQMAGAIDAAIPSAGRLATLLGAADLGKALGIDGLGPKIKTALGSLATSVGAGDLVGVPRAGETQAMADARAAQDAAKARLREGLTRPGAVASAVEASDRLDFRPRTAPDRSQALPSLTPRRSGGGPSDLDAVNTFVNGLEKSAAAAKAEAEAFNKSNAEKQVAIQLARAQEIASQNGRALTEEETAAITKAATAVVTYRDKIQDLEQAQREAAETARFFGDTIANSFADAIFNGRKFSDILRGLQAQLGRAALQAVFSGQGPLASLLGTSPSASAGPNAVGGLAGTLGDALGSLFRANGGPVEAGQAYTVGEMGRELFIPNQSGRMVPIERAVPGSLAPSPERRPLAIHVAVNATDARSFLRSEAQMTAALARAVQRGTRGL